MSLKKRTLCIRNSKVHQKVVHFNNKKQIQCTFCIILYSMYMCTCIARVNNSIAGQLFVYNILFSSINWRLKWRSAVCLFSETKDFFCFPCNKQSPKDAAGKRRSFCIHHFLETKNKPVVKNTGWCFAIQLKMTCKNSHLRSSLSMVLHSPLQ